MNLNNVKQEKSRLREMIKWDKARKIVDLDGNIRCSFCKTFLTEQQEKCDSCWAEVRRLN